MVLQTCFQAYSFLPCVPWCCRVWGEMRLHKLWVMSEHICILFWPRRCNPHPAVLNDASKTLCTLFLLPILRYLIWQFYMMLLDRYWIWKLFSLSPVDGAVSAGDYRTQHSYGAFPPVEWGEVSLLLSLAQMCLSSLWHSQLSRSHKTHAG